MKFTQDEVNYEIEKYASEISTKTKDFSELLDELVDISDKKKKLWKEIYENALVDRHNAYSMFTQLVSITQDKSAEHAIHGRTVSSYLERMSKANEQLIRLAELIGKSESKTQEIDQEELYKKINNGL
jgi:hypothetical protein